ncbi:ABC transporter substrate-binding protein [Aurantimonas endophytica]|uniref:Peptide/nickel transport system substrate-binding protein n=1 Tax=Aurantimonas endophytica TaxID=1522175 RepID=A0A7W6MQZ7_9HYPH|nr:ABC transporter substrate-binding protein [Aurantimonas endophytica]MBB4004560.1 peptide/nickel transport system substrate-binding protein [Aurantimonas endophytica]MCO6405396.1 ABC transporter substrate-binding protein [Aurantimonas endophytica]
MKIRLNRISMLALGAALLATPAVAGPEDNSLNWASDSMPSNIDFYQHTIREGIVLANHIWGGLLYRNDETGEFEPHLAESFRFVDDTTIEFVLRKGVKFHNGEKLTADDVVATVEYVTTNATPQPIFFLEGAEKVDDYTVRLKTAGVFPPILEYVANLLPIYPAKYYAEVGPEGMSRTPIGTGPYRVTEHVAGERITMEAFPDYFGGMKGQPSIETLVFRRIGEFNTQAIELMSGGLDWIWRVPPDAVDRLATSDAIKVEAGETLRIAFLGMDALGRSGDSPMQDLKVRQAVNHAIDREAIREALMGPGSTVINTPCSPAQFGCVVDAAVTYDYDPEKARALLAEAGYPDGFSLEFWGYRDRPLIEAVLGSLAEVGINGSLNFVQASAIATARDEGKLPMWFQAWGSNSIRDISGSAGYWFSGSEVDYSKDERVIELLEEGNTSDNEQRLKAYREMITRITEQAYQVPLFTYALNYAYNSKLEFTPVPDETPRFFQSRWVTE